MSASGASGLPLRKTHKEEDNRVVEERPSTNSSKHSTKASIKSESTGFRAWIGLQYLGRRTLGIILLLVTVFLWTTSNFLASFIFADDTYSKPYFVTYINTSFFAVSLIPMLFKSLYKNGIAHARNFVIRSWKDSRHGYLPIRSDSLSQDEETGEMNLDSHSAREHTPPEDVLGLIETAKLSLEFSLLWFVANYLVAAGLEYTSVGSSTILSSTSSIWTLIFGILTRVESFSIKKVIGVLASLAGIILISSVDLSGEDNDENRGDFPHKSTTEIAIGDAMALASAFMYGVYSIVMKKRIGNEDRVDMPLFFGLVGLFNVILLWPGFIVLDVTGIENFELPPSGHVWSIVLLNSAFSLASDYTWAFSMLLTTPLVVTVGLSLSIPLSLVGQMIISSQYSSGPYWIGAFIVFISFLIVNHESKKEEED